MKLYKLLAYISLILLTASYFHAPTAPQASESKPVPQQSLQAHHPSNPRSDFKPFEPYYINISSGKDSSSKSLEDLEALLKNVRWQRAYEPSKFDCSEMSAYLEWYLELHGYDAVIAADFHEGHAWVMVRNVSGRTYAVESIHNPPSLQSSATSMYARPDEIFEDIYEAQAQWYADEFDWWR